MVLLEIWSIKFVPHPTGTRTPHLLASPRDMCCLGRTLCSMLRLMPLFCSNDRSELQYLLTSSAPLTTAPQSLKDSFDFGGPLDTEGGKLSVSVQFSRPASRTSSRLTPSSALCSTLTAAAVGHSGATSVASPQLLDSHDPKRSPPVAVLPPKRHSLTPGSAPETTAVFAGTRRGSLQPSPVGSLEGPGSFGGGSRIFSPAVAVRYAGSGQPTSTSGSASVGKAPYISSNQLVEHTSQATAGAGNAMTVPSPPQ
jgi:hypothetical protein